MSLDTLPAPVAARLRRPSWRDPRLVIGVVLVALSVALGSWAVSAASRTTEVWAAAQTLTPGTPLTTTALRPVKVRLGDETARYVRVDEPLPAGAVATRVVGEGELVARSALGDAAQVDLRSVAVEVSRAVSQQVHRGSVVDVWFVPATRPGGETTPTPRVIVEGVQVDAVADSGSGLVVGSATTLHLLVPTEDLAEVLGALGDDGTVDVVPVPGGKS